MNPKSRFKTASAFTLIEMTIVVSIIAILATLSVAGARSLQNSAKKRKAETQIKVLSLGLEKYYQKYGGHPVETSDAEGGKCLYQALSGDGSNYISGATPPKGSNGEAGSAGAIILEKLAFFNLKNPDDGYGMVQRIGDDYSLVDPFGNEYRYRAAAPKYNTESYDLYSIMSDESESNPQKWAKNW